MQRFTFIVIKVLPQNSISFFVEVHIEAPVLNRIHIIPLTIPVQLFQQFDFGFAEALVVLAQRTALQKFPVLKHFIDVDMCQAYDFIAVARNALDNTVRAERNQSIPDGRFADFVFLNEFLFRSEYRRADICRR